MSSEVEGRLPTAVELLRFADQKDVDDFVAGLAKLESGEWTADQFRLFRLNRGTYGQRQDDVNMIRVKFPLGAGTAEQLEAMADVCEQYSRGFAHVTTRQNFQIHFLKLKDAPAAQRRMAEVGLTTKEACGNTVRNVTGCPTAGCCGEEAFDVTAYGHAVTRFFLRFPKSQSLPRKFKIAFSGCADDCGMGAINDVGCIAALGQDGTRGFKVKVAGGLSTTPEDAHTLFEFLPADKLIGVIEALIVVFDTHGNRQNKSRARLKYVVRKHGWDGFKKLFDAAYAEVVAAGGERRPIDASANEHLARAPKLPVLGGAGDRVADSPDFLRWKASNVRAQKQKGFAIATVRLRRGDITGAQLRGLAQLVRQHADGQVRLTIDQNILVRFVSESRLPALYAGLAALGLAEADAGTIADVTSCPGADSCNLAVTQSRELATALTEKLVAAQAAGGAQAEAVAAARDANIKISGCPNSCGQHHIAGIGFHGGMRRVGGRVVPEYTLHLGGGIDAGGATFGRQNLLKVPARRAGDALIALLELYVAHRQPGETAVTFFRRVDGDLVKSALLPITKIDEATARPEDFLDNGETSEFMVNTKDGECAA